MMRTGQISWVTLLVSYMSDRLYFTNPQNTMQSCSLLVEGIDGRLHYAHCFISGEKYLPCSSLTNKTLQLVQQPVGARFAMQNQ